MAGFRTHLTTAMVGGTLLAVVGWQAGFWPPGEALSVAALVAFGGILPDIDADNSHAVRLIFNTLALLAMVTGALLMQARLEPGSLLMACGGIYVGVRYLLSSIFKRISVHRGIWHSLLAGVLCALATSAVGHRLLALEPSLAWSQGGAVLLGFCIHLLLDEVYSVDLTGGRLKRSFGSAFKLFDYREPLNSLLMLLLVASLVPLLPAWAPLLALLEQGAALWR